MKSAVIASPDNSGLEKSARTSTHTFDFDDDSEDGAPSSKKSKQGSVYSCPCKYLLHWSLYFRDFYFEVYPIERASARLSA